MFTFDYRPNKFGEVVGHKVVKKVLKAVLDNPESSPKTFIFIGEWGTGKTCLAQIFGRKINCVRKGKSCNNCKECLSLNLYYELDSSIMVNVASTRELQESLYYSIEKGYRTVVIDELQVASKAAQSSFLKVLENPPEKTFFFLLTTDADDILKPIISRSMELNFYLLSDAEISSVLDRILEKEQGFIEPEVRNVIIRRGNGHARDAVTLLEMALMIGGEEFLNTVKINDQLFSVYVKNLLNGDSNYEKIVEDLVKSPVAYLKVDLERFVMGLFKRMYSENKPIYDGKLTEKILMKFLQYYVKFKPLLVGSSSEFYSFLLGLKSVLKPTDNQKSNLLKFFTGSRSFLKST